MDSVTDQLKLLRSDMGMLRGEMGDVKSLLQEILTEFRKIANKSVERQEMEDILNTEDFAAEEGYDEDSQTYYNIPEPNATRAAPADQPVVPQFPYGTLQQYMPGLMWPGSLPFSEGQQLPDFRSLQSGLPVAVPIGPMINIPAAGMTVAPTAPATGKFMEFPSNFSKTSEVADDEEKSEDESHDVEHEDENLHCNASRSSWSFFNFGSASGRIFGSGDVDADDVYDPHYKPITDLPDAIEVKTGEEDEVKLFCKRAKLYRFDTGTKEWKERGVGDLKILHNPEHGSYRILMRREHVHKTVCNMRISSQLELHPMNKSANAWIWYGSNYLDEGDEDEQLAVKFKTEQSSGLFKCVIDSCLRRSWRMRRVSTMRID